ncbi:MAG: dienelactone hydrolase family protein [Gammaproteobacteria bacterium]|nr:MAG: dienelactone hydrolase family protein [Gammaproteobacteria bacterium]
MMRWITTLVLVFICIPAQAAIQGEAVFYKYGDTEMKGYLAYDDTIKGKRPGVLVVHEWWGHNEYARMRARMLAELGYIALAIDMYGNGRQADHPKDAARFSGEVKKNMPVAEARFRAAMKVLNNHPLTDNSKLAAIGYCFGGGIVLEMARRGVDLKGVASFHGSLGTRSPARRGRVKAQVLVLHGAADPFTRPEQITAFKKEMSEAGVKYKFVSYPGARHAFTNPAADGYGKKFNLPLAYHAEADKASWQEMKRFLKKVF